MREPTYITPIILVKKNLQTQSRLKIICKRWSKKEGFHAFVAPITLCSLASPIAMWPLKSFFSFFLFFLIIFFFYDYYTVKSCSSSNGSLTQTNISIYEHTPYYTHLAKLCLQLSSAAADRQVPEGKSKQVCVSLKFWQYTS
jgi:hypothetical protein